MGNIEEIKQVIDSYIKEEKFLNVKDFFHFAKCLIFITYKGTGKSYSAMKACIEELKKGNEFAWIRNTDIELQNSKVDDSFSAILQEEGLDNEYIVRRRGIYKINPNKPHEKGILKGVFANMNSPYNLASQNALNKCVLIVYDEFINPTFHKKNLFSDFMKLAHTLMRKQEATIIMLGNKHEANNDLLAELGLEFNWELNTNQYIFRPEQEVLGLYLTRWTPKGMKGSNELIEKLSKYSPSMINFTQGNISSNTMESVKNWYIHNIEAMFRPKFKFDLNQTRYCVGEIISDKDINIFGVERPIYIKQLDFNSEFEGLYIYCYRPMDKLPDNKFVYDIENFKTVNFLLNRYSKGELFFSSAFGKEEFKLLLPFLKTILLNENK